MTAKGERDLYIAINELDMVKIGISTNVERRIREIANASGLAVRLIAKTPLTKLKSYGAEQYILARFEKYRAVGEWFSADILADHSIEEIIAFTPEVYDLRNIKDAVSRDSHNLEKLFDNFRVGRFLPFYRALEYIADDMERLIKRKPSNLNQYTQLTYMLGAYDCVRLILKNGFGIELDAFDSKEKANRDFLKYFDKKLAEIREQWPGAN